MCHIVLSYLLLYYNIPDRRKSNYFLFQVLDLVTDLDLVADLDFAADSVFAADFALTAHFALEALTDSTDSTDLEASLVKNSGTVYMFDT